MINMSEDAYKGKTTNDAKSDVQNLDTTQPNPLNKFASFNTIFTLSALTRAELETLSYWDTSYKPQNIIARSGGMGDPNTKENASFQVTVGEKSDNKTIDKAREIQAGLDTEINAVRNILNRGFDFYFQSVNIKTLPSASNDRLMTSVTTIDMEILEPLGLSLIQCIRAAAYNSGYLDHVDAPFLLTIDYKGFDDNGKSVPTGSTYVRKIPIKFIKVSVNVNEGGSVYQIRAIPTSEFAFVNRLNYTRTIVTANTQGTLSSFCKDLTTKLNDQTSEEQKSKFFERADQYVITCDLDLDKAFIESNTQEKIWMQDTDIKTKDSFAKNKTKIPVGQFAKGTGIHAILSQVMKLVAPFSDMDSFYKQWIEKANGEWSGQLAELKTDEQREQWIRKNEDKFYVNFFKINSSIHHTPGPVDNITKKHTALMHYHIEPYKIHILNFAQPGLSANIKQFLENTRQFMARKRYDYIFTGQNTEVLSLDITYNIAYYASKYKGLQQQQNRTDQPINNFSNVGVYSRGDQVEVHLPLTSYPGGGKTTNVGLYGANEAYDSFLDSFSNPGADMVAIDMEIRGDPVYLSANQFNTMKKPTNLEGGVYSNVNASKTTQGRTDAYDVKTQSYNLNLAEPFVIINFKSPVDIDLNTGLYKFNQGDQVVFSGLYRVVTIENKFDRGTFTQQLRLIRLKNQGNKVTPAISEKVNDTPHGFVDPRIDLEALYNDFTGTSSIGFFDSIKNWVKQKIKNAIGNNNPFGGGPGGGS
jgi:hypothetical protein